MNLYYGLEALVAASVMSRELGIEERPETHFCVGITKCSINKMQQPE